MPLSTVSSAASPATACGRGISIYNAYLLVQPRNIVSYFLQQGFGLFLAVRRGRQKGRKALLSFAWWKDARAEGPGGERL